MKILLRDYVESEKIIIPCRMQSVVFFYIQGDESRKLLCAVLEKNPHRPARGEACLALANQTANRLLRVAAFKNDPELAKRYERRFGKEAIEPLLKEDLETLRHEAESYYDRVAKEFTDVRDLTGAPLGKLAQQKREDLHRQMEAYAHPILVGKPAPEIEGNDIEGKTFKLSDYRGKVVLLDYWGHWCPSCRAMYAQERSLVKRLEGQPFVLLGVNSDQDRAKLLEILAKEKITWRSFWDDGSRQGRISTRWNIEGWPTLFLIDAKGALRHKYVGSPGEKVLDEEVDKLIAEIEKSTVK